MNAHHKFPTPVLTPWTELVTCIRSEMHDNPTGAIFHAQEIADRAEALAAQHIETFCNTAIAMAARSLVDALNESDPASWADYVDELAGLLCGDEPKAEFTWRGASDGDLIAAGFVGGRL